MRSAMDQLRDANPLPTPLPAPPIDPTLTRLDESGPEPPAPPPPACRRLTSRLFERPAGWAVPAAGVLTTIAVVAVALGVLKPSHRPQRATSRSAPNQTSSATGSKQTRSAGGPGRTLSARAYAFAVGGDANAPGGAVLLHAEQVLRERCMRQRGFGYIVLPPPARTALPSVTGYPSTFYPQPLLTAYPESALLALREREGFGLASALATQGHDTDPNDQYLKTLSPAQQRLWRTAWMGRNGCYGQTEVQLFGSRRAANLEQLLPTKIYDEPNTAVYTPRGSISPSNPATRNAAAAWARCMQATTGQTWTDENALVTSLSDQHNAFAKSEIHLAVADTKCAYRTGQAQTFAAAFRRAATQLPPTTTAELRFLLARRNAWIKKANDIVASAGS